jgi:hypothetical protein
MKKKEMIKLMCDVFYEEHKDVFDDSNKRLNMFDVVNGMVAVLDKMEQAGMTPPSFTEEKWVDCGDGQRCETISKKGWDV